jgi:hypothetical protein
VIGPERRILLLWAIAIVVISRQALRAGTMPHPHAFVSSAILYGMASLLAEVAPQPATYLAAGWTLRLVYLDLASDEGSQPRKRSRRPRRETPPPGRKQSPPPPRRLAPIAQGVARPRRRRPVASRQR